jgi:hypothetical protein
MPSFWSQFFGEIVLWAVVIFIPLAVYEFVAWIRARR